MAGAIPITLRPAEGEMLRSLNDVRLSAFLAVLDELGWVPAREVLALLADDQLAANEVSRWHENNKRPREIDDDDTCASAESVER